MQQLSGTYAGALAQPMQPRYASPSLESIHLLKHLGAWAEEEPRTSGPANSTPASAIMTPSATPSFSAILAKTMALPRP